MPGNRLNDLTGFAFKSCQDSRPACAGGFQHGGKLSSCLLCRAGNIRETHLRGCGHVQERCTKECRSRNEEAKRTGQRGKHGNQDANRFHGWSNGRRDTKESHGGNLHTAVCLTKGIDESRDALDALHDAVLHQGKQRNLQSLEGGFHDGNGAFGVIQLDICHLLRRIRTRTNGGFQLREICLSGIQERQKTRHTGGSGNGGGKSSLFRFRHLRGFRPQLLQHFPKAQHVS